MAKNEVKKKVVPNEHVRETFFQHAHCMILSFYVLLITCV